MQMNKMKLDEDKKLEKQDSHNSEKEEGKYNEPKERSEEKLRNDIDLYAMHRIL